MFERVFPTSVDNQYNGHVLGKWLLYFYIFKSFLSGCIHMFASDGGAQSIASITLDQFSTGAANTVITIFGLWGMEQFVIGLSALVIIWRYKALIPVMALAYVVEYLGRFGLEFITPGVQVVHQPPGVIADYVLVPLALVMLLLSIYQRKENRVD